MNEAELRDRIAADLNVIEPGLVLLEKERFIPNRLGTRGFIDLYARDRAGHHVLIELKRSDSSAREAIHEVHKYVEGVKRHFGAREDEIRVIVASTEWGELLVPFSRFASETSLATSGLQLIVDENERTVRASPVSLVPTFRGRVIAPWHDVHWHADKASLEAGIKSIDDCCRNKGVEDYVVLVIEFPSAMISEHERKMAEMISEIAAAQGITPSDQPLPEYECIAYFAVQPLSEEACLEILRRDPEIFEEVTEIAGEMEVDERIKYLNEQVISLEPNPAKDHFEIGYAAKLAMFIDQLGGQIRSVLRHGMFARNQLLDDAVIVSELRGEDGATGQRLKRTINVANRAHVASARADIAECLAQNPAWKNHISSALDEIVETFPSAEVDINIFNPSTGLMTIHYATVREDGLLFVPTYGLVVREADEARRMYYGALQTCGPVAPLRSLLNKYYEGDLFGLLMTSSWGGYESRDVDILEDFGLAYRSFRCDLDGDEMVFYARRDERWREMPKMDPLQSFYSHLETCLEEVREINKKLGDRIVNGVYKSTSVREHLGSIADLEQGKLIGRYFIGAPEKCDLCKCPLAEEKYVVDGAVAGHDAWAFMCQDCFEIDGRGIGWGMGQLYARDSEGWLLVAGFSPEDVASRK